jgi:hypothetical protein
LAERLPGDFAILDCVIEMGFLGLAIAPYGSIPQGDFLLAAVPSAALS